MTILGSPVFDGKSAEFLKVKGMCIPFTFKNSGFHPVNPGRPQKMGTQPGSRFALAEYNLEK
jgi:hypothetical protein